MRQTPEPTPTPTLGPTPVRPRRSGRSRTTRLGLGLGVALVVGLVLSGLALTGGPTLAQPPATRALQAHQEIPEELLLDVAIQIFDPGLPPGLEDWEMREEDIFPDVRRAEARYLPVKLMQVLQATGQWGAVRVVPQGSGTADVRIRGRIEESMGSELVLTLDVADSTGRHWYSEKYKAEADPGAYQDQDEVSRIRDDPFIHLYREIANDLVKRRGKLDAEEIRELRRVSELRFAADMAPDAFDEYLDRDRKGRYEVVRLPAEGDPMLERVRDVRDRDYLFIDTVTDYYAAFHARMDQPYDSWRRYAYHEEEERRRIRRKARKRKILGALGILGGVLINPGGRVGSAAQDAAVIGGVLAVQSGIAKSKEARIHEEALKELAQSFDAEVEPMLLEVEGQTLKLSGSVETQFQTWREILHTIFLEETGLPLDPDTGEPLAVEVSDVTAPSQTTEDSTTEEPAGNDSLP